MKTNLIQSTFTLIALLIFTLPAYASDQDINEQLANHHQAEKELIHSFIVGRHQETAQATRDIIAIETYLATSGLSALDSRLLLSLYQKNDDAQSFASHVLIKRLKESIGYQNNIGTLFSDVEWDNVRMLP